MVKGVTINMGGEDYVVPPLNFGQLQKYKAEIKLLNSLGDTGDAVSELHTLLPVILVAVQRNYPEMSAEKLSDIVDMGNYREVFETILGVTAEMKEILKSRLSRLNLAGEAKPAARIQ